MLNNPYAFVGTPTKFAQAVLPVSPTITTWHTVPAFEKAAINEIFLCNTTSSAITVDIYAGAGTTTAQALLYGYTLAAKGIIQITCYQVLNAADTISGSASATGITATISGMAQI